ncbi:hypothetical protein BP5796_04666 [Coleophoma crateriformis]|uniref:Uncharacterized protein n=1 Tax=Coleophoma crateriformis TaxID=565419 RepID=A0A3D8SA12_9HELO|nr:hypothetical protein BP5796_04666 [Coleophoma crateriformis]
MEKDIAEQSHCLERPKEQRRIGILSIASVREKVARLPTAGILMTLICLLLVLDISVRYPTSAGYCSRKLSLPTPLAEPAASPRENKFFNNSLTTGGSPWRQGPNNEVDLMWKSIIQENLIAISDDQVRKLGKDPAYFRRVPRDLQAKYGDNLSHHI